MSFDCGPDDMKKGYRTPLSGWKKRPTFHFDCRTRFQSKQLESRGLEDYQHCFEVAPLLWAKAVAWRASKTWWSLSVLRAPCGCSDSHCSFGSARRRSLGGRRHWCGSWFKLLGRIYYENEDKEVDLLSFLNCDGFETDIIQRTTSLDWCLMSFYSSNKIWEEIFFDRKSDILGSLLVSVEGSTSSLNFWSWWGRLWSRQIQKYKWISSKRKRRASFSSPFSVTRSRPSSRSGRKEQRTFFFYLWYDTLHIPELTTSCCMNVTIGRV